MAIREEGQLMNRGLLTESQRDFLTGDKDDVESDSYRYNLRSDFRARMNRLEEDLEYLAEAGEEDLVEEFYQRFSRTARIEQEIAELRKQVDD